MERSAKGGRQNGAASSPPAGERRGITEARKAPWRGGANGCKWINLALQGGGAHGAFGWGVLDRLLDDERIAIDGISATSAGAMNAVALAAGLATGGREGAKKVLGEFWLAVARMAAFSPLQPTMLDRLTGNRMLDSSPPFMFFDFLTRIFSPYQLNPLNYNPIRDVLAATVDFSALAEARCPVKLFLSATNVRTGKIRVFGNDELAPDVVLASACLPLLFQAVEVDGEHYWDGGYMGNPALYPLIYHCDSRDILVLHINPIEREALPKTATEILNRINEISFNSSLMREMRAIAFVSKLIEEGELSDNKMKKMLIHGILPGEPLDDMGVASKLNADLSHLLKLREIGRARADTWLAENYDRIGQESTIDIRANYL